MYYSKQRTSPPFSALTKNQTVFLLRMAYEESNRGKVMAYLTRNIGFNEAKVMFTTQSIPPEWLEVIAKVIIAPKKTQPLVPESPLDFSDPLIHDHAIRYLARVYGEAEGVSRLETRAFTAYDEKMMRTMIQLNATYTSLKVSRRNTQMTSQHEMQLADVSKKEQERRTAKTVIAKAKSSPAKVSVVSICRAFKMNGDKCTAKTKNADGFCARHAKK